MARMPTHADESVPHRFLVIGSSMSDNMAGNDFESFWLRLALDVPVLSDIGFGETKPMKVFALPALIFRSNRGPGHLISDVFIEGLAREGKAVEVEFTKQAVIDAGYSIHQDWIKENLPLPSELPAGETFRPRYDVIVALDIFFKDFKSIDDFNAPESGINAYRKLESMKAEIADLLRRFAFHAKEVIVGSPLNAYGDLIKDPDTGLLIPQRQGPRQGHEWLLRLVSGTAKSDYLIPDEATGYVEIFDLRNLMLTIQRDEEIHFELYGDSYQASLDQVLAGDMRHASKNGSKLLANCILEGMYARNPDWRPFMGRIPFEARSEVKHVNNQSVSVFECGNQNVITQAK